jgi:hypothetical protein
MAMEKIYFDDTTFIWKTKLNLEEYRAVLLNEANDIMDSQHMNKNDGFSIIDWVDNVNSIGEIGKTNKISEVSQISINLCKQVYETNNTQFNKVNVETWINRVRCKNPVQKEYWADVDMYHTHTEIQSRLKSFYPHYTFVYYIQMPDIMNGHEGVLYFKSKKGVEYYIKPEEDELIIMEGDMPHSPQAAPNSTIDRVVLAGNVGFEFIKKNNSVI